MSISTVILNVFCFNTYIYHDIYQLSNSLGPINIVVFWADRYQVSKMCKKEADIKHKRNTWHISRNNESTPATKVIVYDFSGRVIRSVENDHAFLFLVDYPGSEKYMVHA